MMTRLSFLRRAAAITAGIVTGAGAAWKARGDAGRAMDSVARATRAEGMMVGLTPRMRYGLPADHDHIPVTVYMRRDDQVAGLGVYALTFFDGKGQCIASSNPDDLTPYATPRR